MFSNARGMWLKAYRRRGFSLVEIMVVLVIIGLLAGFVTINVRAYMITGKQQAARSQIATFVAAIESFYVHHDRYPSNDEGLEVLTQKTQELPEPLLVRIPVDPWGHSYQYNQPGREGPYEVICLGADGRPGGSSADADIQSFQLDRRP